MRRREVQGYLAHKKTPNPLDHHRAHRPTAGSYGGVVSYERGTSAKHEEEQPPRSHPDARLQTF